MRNLPIAIKFLIALGMMAIMTIGVSLYAVTNLSEVDAAYSDLLQREGKGASAMERIFRVISHITGLTYRLIAETDAVHLRQIEADIDANIKLFGEQTAIVTKTLPKEMDRINKIIFDFRALQPDIAKVQSLARINKDAEATEAMRSVNAEMLRLSQDVAELSDEATAAADARAAAISVRSKTTHDLTLVVAFAMSLLLLFLSYLIANFGVSKPIVELVSLMERLVKGDTNILVVGQDRRDEIGASARALQVFKENALEVERLKTEQMALERRAADEKKRSMTQLADGFESNVRHVVSAVSSAAQQLRNTAQVMSTNADQTNHRCTVVAAAAEQASANVQTVAAATEQLSGSIIEISRQVSESTRIGTSAVEEANRANATVNGLADAAQKIGAVVQLINQIASQTNLLALNATIEAARAGEAGKGFAVVASEVKNLANQTAKAPDEIQTQVGQMQSVTGTTVDAIKNITGTIRRMSEISTTIASAVEQQGAATREIARNVGEASKGTQEVSSNIAGVSQAANETGRGASETLSAATNLGTQSEKLAREVDQFISTIRRT